MDLARLKQLLERPGFSQAELARRMGINPSAVNRMLKGERKILASEVATIESYLRDSLVPIQPTPPLKPQILSTVALQNGTVDLPIYGCTDTGRGIWEINPEPVGKVERPPHLRYSAHAFGIYCHGTQQSPAFEPKDMILVDPARPVAVGDDVVFVKNYSIGDAQMFQGILRRLIGETEKHWLVRQFNPPSDYKISREEWPKALLVAGKYSR